MIETSDVQEDRAEQAPSGWTATQSSVASGGPASRAIDGNFATTYGSNSCTHTEKQERPWWEVDLGSSKSISAVTVTNRGDCCGSRLSGFNVAIDGTECASNVAIAQGEKKEVPCSGTGQVVRVTLPGTEYLTICEFEVVEAEEEVVAETQEDETEETPEETPEKTPEKTPERRRRKMDAARDAGDKVTKDIGAMVKSGTHRSLFSMWVVMDLCYIV